jgi:hypothetical protein
MIVVPLLPMIAYNVALSGAFAMPQRKSGLPGN